MSDDFEKIAEELKKDMPMDPEEMQQAANVNLLMFQIERIEMQKRLKALVSLVVLTGLLIAPALIAVAWVAAFRYAR